MRVARQRFSPPSGFSALRSSRSRSPLVQIGATQPGVAETPSFRAPSGSVAPSPFSSGAAAALVVLGRGGLLWSGRGLARFYRWGTWVVAAGSALGSLANFASQSRHESFILGPLALTLAILCVVVARSQSE
jgi:hypothetical protein